VIFDNEMKLFECRCLELPWLDNRVEVSCVPERVYTVQKHISPKFGECFHVLDVPGRTDILIHKGNYKKDTKGCILPGRTFADLNADGWADVTSSGPTLDYLLDIMPDEFELTIIS